MRFDLKSYIMKIKYSVKFQINFMEMYIDCSDALQREKGKHFCRKKSINI